MWWIIGIVVVCLIIYSINKDHKEDVQMHVSNYGGMQGKYGKLIDHSELGGLHIQKMTKDSVILSSNSMIFSLDYIGSKLEVRMKGYMPLIGNINKNWTFPDSYPQEKMINEIDDYFDWQTNQLKKISESNPYNHINK